MINRPHFVLAKVIAPKQKTLVKQKQITKVRTCCEDVNGRPVLEFNPLWYSIEIVCWYQSQYWTANGRQSWSCWQTDDHEETSWRRCGSEQRQENEPQKGWQDGKLICYQVSQTSCIQQFRYLLFAFLIPSNPLHPVPSSHPFCILFSLVIPPHKIWALNSEKSRVVIDVLLGNFFLLFVSFTGTKMLGSLKYIRLVSCSLHGVNKISGNWQFHNGRKIGNEWRQVSKEWRRCLHFGLMRR